MKEGWEYKKLGEVATYLNGYAFKPSEWVESGMPIIRIQNLNNPSAVYNYFDGDIADKYIVRKGDILISWSASLGAYEWKGPDALLNQHIFKVVFDKTDIDKYYLKYAVESKIEDMLMDVHGATMKHIIKKDFDNTKIPYPILSEQQQIVAELDLLSGIIEKQKAQLEELDKLAQSIFYDMFGDPVTNEKGWKQEKLGHIFQTSSGGTPSKNNIEYYEGGSIPWLRSGEVSQGFIYKTELFITEAGMNNSSAKIFPVDTVAIAMYGATVGQVGIIKVPMTTNQAVCGLFPNPDYSPIFMMFFLKGMQPVFLKDATGGAQPNISQGIIKNTYIPLISLSLQQEFAAKVEAIEAMKEKVRQSLKEAETLFNERMDYYFN